MKKIVISIVFGVVLISSALPQAARDVLSLSQYYATGTARSVAMSGAFGALGGDLSVLSTNPAGLAVYRGSEFSFSPALNFTKTSALLDGITSKEKNSRFNINNIGYAYTWNFFNQKGVKSINIGLAYNRLSDFNADAYITTPSLGSSLLDEFVMYSNGFKPEQLYEWYEGLAYKCSAIDLDPGSTTEYYSDYNDFGYEEEMVRSVSYRGGIGEYDISVGTNINNKLYLGFTWGIHDVYYGEFYSHEEYPDFRDPSTYTLDWYVFNEDFTIKGWGMNAKLGVIYRPINLLRFGLAIHTPTFYHLTTEDMTDMTVHFHGIPERATTETTWGESPILENDFKVSTPWRYNASAAVIIGNIGLVSLDAEFLNYSKNEMTPNKDYSGVNDMISNDYKNAVNLKAGTEFKVGPMSLRAGMAYYGTPYKDDLDIFDDEVKNKSTFSYSGGIGFRARSFYMDAAYSYTKFPKYYYDLYEKAKYQFVSSPMQKIRNKVVLTFGFKF